MPAVRYNCGHPGCTMWHSGSHKPRADVCPSVRFKPVRSLKCPQCGARFEAQGKEASGRRFCSEKCRIRFGFDNARSRPSWPIRTCETCGQSFSCRPDRQSRWCSRACRYAGTMPSVKNHRGRARFYGAEFDASITRNALMVRDDWRCGICQGSIDPALVYDARNWNPGYGTIDHILPMSRGGAHVWGNVQATHALCNTVKADQIEGATVGPTSDTA